MNTKLRDLIVTNFLAIFLGLLISASLLLFINVEPTVVFISALQTIFTDKYTLGEVFLKATPLIFTALAFSFTFKANLFNIGAQGQFYMGAIAAISSSLLLQDKVPAFILFILVGFSTAIAGGVIGALIGFLKAKFNANEFLVSMMSTYVIQALMNYLLRTFLMESKKEYPQTDALKSSSWLPTIAHGTRLNIGFILAIVLAIFIWIILYKTTFGFRIRSVGSNAIASKVSGINAKRIYILTFFISGALAGLAGFTEVNGVQHMLIQDLNPGVGAAGLGIAILANSNPIGIIFASLLFGILNVIGTLMGRMSNINVPSSFIELMQGSVMIFVIMSYFFRNYLNNRREKLKLKRMA